MTQRKLNKIKGGMWEPTTGLVISMKYIYFYKKI